MKYRWTKGSLREVSDEFLMDCIIDEKLSKLKSQSPFSKRLMILREHIHDDSIITFKRN